MPHIPLFLVGTQESPVKMEITASVEVLSKTEPSPRKTKSAGEISPSPSKQRRQKQNQNVKLKLDCLVQKDPELTRRRPIRKASRKNYYPDSLNVLVGAKIIYGLNLLA